MSVGSRIREERTKSGLSLQQLADAAGLSKTYLLRLESDPHANPSLAILRDIADALDITVADLLERPKLVFDRPAEIPASLAAFADQSGLSKGELRTLASIRWRKGDEPQTVERWRYVFESLKLSRQLDEPNQDIG